MGQFVQRLDTTFCRYTDLLNILVVAIFWRIRNLREYNNAILRIFLLLNQEFQ